MFVRYQTIVTVFVEEDVDGDTHFTDGSRDQPEHMRLCRRVIGRGEHRGEQHNITISIFLNGRRRHAHEEGVHSRFAHVVRLRDDSIACIVLIASIGSMRELRRALLEHNRLEGVAIFVHICEAVWNFP